MNAQERDLDCIRRVCRRDSSALAEMYDRYTTALLYPVALRIVGDPAEAEEAIQETWLQAWRSAERYDARRGPVAAWLLTIARTRALDRVRSVTAKRRREADADEPDRPALEVEETATSHLEDRERRATVRAALGALESHHRQVLEIAYFDGQSQSGIARQLGVPLGTVKSWTRQALSRLRAQLLPEGRP